MGQSKSCAWKSPELQCKLQRNPNIKLECVKVGELSLDNPVSNRGDVKLLPSPKLYGQSDHIDAKSFILTDFKRSPFFHNSEHSLIGCEVLICGLGIALMVSRALESRAEIFYRAQLRDGRTFIVPIICCSTVNDDLLRATLRGNRCAFLMQRVY